MAVSYPNLRDGLNLGPPYTAPIETATNSSIILTQDSSIDSSYSYPGGMWKDSFVSGHSAIPSRPNRNEMQIQELTLSLGAEITGPASVNPPFDYQYPLSYPGSYQYELIGLANSGVVHSKYLKPVQMLLDETVKSRKSCKQADQNKFRNACGFDSNESKENDGQFRNQLVQNQGDNMGDSLELLSSEEKQDLQNRKSKLLAMLEEVDKRYSQYYHEMQSLISSFEMVAGYGAAKPYTSVALKRLSRNFRSLRDAIKTQIRVMRSRLGEHESSIDDQGERIPRLRYVDQQIRQRRAYHQIGTMRPVWRPPQRGLPENSVSILRAWLFEHFLHPYPKDSEKILLAKQTGLTRNQVANWFINARVRLWKPMIEQMYKEEFGDYPEVNPMITSSQDNEHKQHREISSQQELQETATSTSSSMDPNANEISNPFVGRPNIGDYHHHYMVVGMVAHHHQDRFTDPHQFHDFVV